MLNSRLLKQFIAVAEELHFGRAAERVNIAQSPLSQAMQKLETYVGTALFLRNKRAVSLTPAGKVFLDEAYQWLKYEQLAIERAQSAKNGEIGHLSIGFIGSAGYGFMPTLINHFRQSHPRIRLRLVEMTTLDQLEQLKNRYLDLGLLRTPLAQKTSLIQTHLYAHDKLMVALPKKHPLSGQKTIGLKQLAHESFVAFSKEKVPAAHAQMIAACSTAGFYPDIAQECSQVASVICFVAAGLSIALIPSNLTALIHPKVQYIPLSDKTPFLNQEISIAWRNNDDSPALASFLKAAKSLQEQIGLGNRRSPIQPA